MAVAALAQRGVQPEVGLVARSGPQQLAAGRVTGGRVIHGLDPRRGGGRHGVNGLCSAQDKQPEDMVTEYGINIIGDTLGVIG